MRIPLSLLSKLALCALLLMPSGAAAAEKTRVVAVIDFRQDERLSDEFRHAFEAELNRESRSGPPVRVEFHRARIVMPPATSPSDPAMARRRAEEADARTMALLDAAVREMQRSQPDVYYATTVKIALAVRRVTSSVPIVFSDTSDPRGELVHSIDRPDGNVTGFTGFAPVDDKRLELLASLNPRIKRIGVLAIEGTISEAHLEKRREAGRRVGVDVVPIRMHAGQGPRVLEAAIKRERLDALDIPTSFYLRQHCAAIIELGVRARIPTGFRSVDFVNAGGVLGYEAREFDYPRKAARIVARILQGTPPADIPIEFPSQFILSLNATTASRLPYPLDETILLRVDRTFHVSKLEADGQLGDRGAWATCEQVRPDRPHQH